MPCHKQESHKKTQPPATADCSHRELIAEQRTGAFTPNQWQPSSFVGEPVQLLADSLPVTYQPLADGQFFRSPHRESLHFILRI